MKYLICGLGNIGNEYEMSRHNIGFMVLDTLAKEKEASFEQGRHVFQAEIKHKGRTLHLIKPTTYMNLSGKAVAHWLKELKIPVEHLMVVTDDIALPFGKIRIKAKGSSGGHNGLKDIEEKLGTNAYPRLRFGVGSDFSSGRQVDHVLSPFTSREQEDMSGHVEKAKDACLAFSVNPLARVMNDFN